jgi:hypothetical protein
VVTASHRRQVNRGSIEVADVPSTGLRRFSIVIRLGMSGCSKTGAGLQKDIDDTRNETGEAVDDI